MLVTIDNSDRRADISQSTQPITSFRPFGGPGPGREHHPAICAVLSGAIRTVPGGSITPAWASNPKDHVIASLPDPAPAKLVPVVIRGLNPICIRIRIIQGAIAILSLIARPVALKTCGDRIAHRGFSA